MTGTGVKAKKHVITRNQASQLLLESGDYFSMFGAGEHVDGKHRSEVIAKAMELDGQIGQADAIMNFHNSMKQFANGDTKALQWFTETPVADNLSDTVKNSKFEASVERIISTAAKIGKILPKREIDWEKSADVIAKVKRERFPDKLTMVEKLTNWQHDQSTKGPSKT